MKKILIINLLLIILLFLIIDYSVFYIERNRYSANISYLQYITRKISGPLDYDIESLKDVCPKRNPLNLDSNKKSIIFTTCIPSICLFFTLSIVNITFL